MWIHDIMASSTSQTEAAARILRAWRDLPLFFGALVEDIVDEPSFRMLAPSLARRLIPSPHPALG